MALPSHETRSLRRLLWVCALATAILTRALAAQDQPVRDGDTSITGSDALPQQPDVRRPRSGARRPATRVQRTVYTGIPGTIAGSIEDQLGDAMFGVTIRLTDATGSDQTTTATASAAFEFGGLRPGSYTLDFTEAGFARTRLQIEVGEGEHSTQTVVLPIETREETLHITPGGPRVAPSPRTELERFLATRLVTASSPASERCTTGRPCVVAARKIVDRQPAYPHESVTLGAEGVVFIEARITREGMVDDLRALGADSPELNESAMSAVRAWQFEPARINGLAVDTPMTITVEFSLK